MAEPVMVSNLQDVEEQSVGTEAGQIAFVLNSEASLNDAAKMKLRVRAGVEGFRLVNPELLDCKCWMKDAMEDGMKRMIRICLAESFQEINQIDFLIVTLKNRLQGSPDSIPHHGPPLAQRGIGIHQAIYPASMFPRYDQQAPLVEIAEASEEARIQARELDIQSQVAYWTFNLSVLQAKRTVLEAKARELENVLRAQLEFALESNSLLGAGYADYTFLCSAEDVNNQN